MDNLFNLNRIPETILSVASIAVIVFEAIVLLIYLCLKARNRRSSGENDCFCYISATGIFITSAALVVYYFIDMELNDDGEGLYSLIMMPYILYLVAATAGLITAFVTCLKRKEKSEMLIGIIAGFTVTGLLAILTYIEHLQLFAILVVSAKLVSGGTTCIYILNRNRHAREKIEGVYYNPYDYINE